MKINSSIAAYLRQLADWLDPPHALIMHVTCDTSQAIASLDALQAEFQKMLEQIEWEVKCKKE